MSIKDTVATRKFEDLTEDEIYSLAAAALDRVEWLYKIPGEGNRYEFTVEYDPKKQLTSENIERIKNAENPLNAFSEAIDHLYAMDIDCAEYDVLDEIWCYIEAQGIEVNPRILLKGGEYPVETLDSMVMRGMVNVYAPKEPYLSQVGLSLDD